MFVLVGETIHILHAHGPPISAVVSSPFAVRPEVDNVIANLELMPMRANASEKDKVASRQLQRAEELHRAGLLSKAGLQNVRAAAK